MKNKTTITIIIAILAIIVLSGITSWIIVHNKSKTETTKNENSKIPKGTPTNQDIKQNTTKVDEIDKGKDLDQEMVKDIVDQENKIITPPIITPPVYMR